MSPATETQHVLTGLEPVVASWCVAGFSGGHISLNNSARSLQPCGLWYNPDERLAQRGGDGHKKKEGKERERELDRASGDVRGLQGGVLRRRQRRTGVCEPHLE